MEVKCEPLLFNLAIMRASQQLIYIFHFTLRYFEIQYPYQRCCLPMLHVTALVRSRTGFYGRFPDPLLFQPWLLGQLQLQVEPLQQIFTLGQQDRVDVVAVTGPAWQLLPLSSLLACPGFSNQSEYRAMATGINYEVTRLGQILRRHFGLDSMAVYYNSSFYQIFGIAIQKYGNRVRDQTPFR